jgi:hypothetical protein
VKDVTQQSWVEVVFDPTIFGIFILGTIAWGALAADKITDPATIVTAVVGAIAGFVGGQGVEKLREKRRLVESSDKLINLEEYRRWVDEHEKQKAVVHGAPGPGPKPDGGLRGGPGTDPQRK